MVVAVAIISLLSTAALPKAINMDQLIAQYETIRLVNNIRYVQVMSHNVDYWRDSYNGLYDIVRPIVYIWRNGYEVNQSIYHITSYKLTEGCELSSTYRRIYFNMKGTMAAGSIYVGRHGKYYYRIVIDSVGRIRVEKR